MRFMQQLRNWPSVEGEYITASSCDSRPRVSEGRRLSSFQNSNSFSLCV